MENSPREFKTLCQQAMSCNHCFQHMDISRPLIDIAQPRWIGKKYWKALPKVLIIMLNPGSGDGRTDDADAHFRNLLYGFTNGSNTLDEVFRHQQKDMPRWGNGRFWNFYVKGLELSLYDVAFGNIAWCSTRDNKQPKSMFRHCFVKHTTPLIRILTPDIILLSGGNTHSFAGDVQRAVPAAQVVKMLHYAHRKGKTAENEELARVRQLICPSNKD